MIDVMLLVDDVDNHGGRAENAVPTMPRDRWRSGFRNRGAFGRLFDALPEQEREVIALRFFESRPQSEIAERMGLSRVEVFHLLLKALTSLREGH